MHVRELDNIVSKLFSLHFGAKQLKLG